MKYTQKNVFYKLEKKTNEIMWRNLLHCRNDAVILVKPRKKTRFCVWKAEGLSDGRLMIH